MKTNLLINESPLQVLPTLAEKIGLNEAIVLQQLHYWLNNPKMTGRIVDGVKWIFNTYDEWHENFPFWSVRTIARIFANLEESGLVISEQFNKGSYDRTKFYRIDYAKLDIIENDKTVVIDDDKLSYSLIESETTTENTSENKQTDKIISALQNAGIFSGVGTADYLRDWSNEHSEVWIIKAIEKGRGKNMKYIDKILLDWKANGYPKSRQEQIAGAKRTQQPTTYERIPSGV